MPTIESRLYGRSQNCSERGKVLNSFATSGMKNMLYAKMNKTRTN